MYISPVPFEQVGLDPHVPKEPILNYVKGFLAIVPMGLTPTEYKAQFFRNWANRLMIGIFIVGIPIIIQRYLFGLATVTHASNDYPWGLFLGFGLFCMVPLSASGFMLGTTVEIFGRKDFIPIEQLALLNGLLGYFFAVLFLEVDLGMPWHLPYPMFVSLGLGKGCSYAMITYLVIKFIAVAHDQEWSYLLELGIGVFIPMCMFAMGVKNHWVGIVRLAAAIFVLAIIWNRLNTSMIAYNQTS